LPRKVGSELEKNRAFLALFFKRAAEKSDQADTKNL